MDKARMGRKLPSLQRSHSRLPDYSITSSARDSTASGIVSPIALAVLMLTAS
jgi:hypothetical protein